jgi:two-component system phosphate regulon response regulator PhoB
MISPPPTILVADDQKHILLLLQASLAPLNCRMLAAGSGEEVLVKAASQPIDLLLIDFEMSGLTGVQTVRTLKASLQYADLPVILITARGQRRIREEALVAGVTLVIQKPFSPAELLETAQRLLKESSPSSASPPAFPERPPAPVEP